MNVDKNFSTQPTDEELKEVEKELNIQAIPINTDLLSSQELNTNALDVEDIKSIEEFCDKSDMEPQASYEESLSKAIEALAETEGVVELANESVATIIISDIHARKEFLKNILSLEDKKAQKMVLDLLREGRINIVCVGDGMHTEDLGQWDSRMMAYHLNEILGDIGDSEFKIGLQEYKRLLEVVGGKPYEQMTNSEISSAKNDEAAKTKWSTLNQMAEDYLLVKDIAKSLDTMKLIMELKARYPDNFHYIRGNHDDMGTRIKNYEKYAREGERIKQWIINNFGQAFLDKYLEFEDSLPLLVKGSDFVISHTVPEDLLDFDEINQRGKKAQLALTWTDNKISADKVEANIEGNLGNLGLSAEATWIIGHRPVEAGTNYRSQADGHLVQINSEKKQLIAIMYPGRPFSPDDHIHDIS